MARHACMQNLWLQHCSRCEHINNNPLATTVQFLLHLWVKHRVGGRGGGSTLSVRGAWKSSFITRHSPVVQTCSPIAALSPSCTWMKDGVDQHLKQALAIAIVRKRAQALKELQVILFATL